MPAIHIPNLRPPPVSSGPEQVIVYLSARLHGTYRPLALFTPIFHRPADIWTAAHAASLINVLRHFLSRLRSDDIHRERARRELAAAAHILTPPPSESARTIARARRDARERTSTMMFAHVLDNADHVDQRFRRVVELFLSCVAFDVLKYADDVSIVMDPEALACEMYVRPANVPGDLELIDWAALSLHDGIRGATATDADAADGWPQDWAAVVIDVTDVDDVRCGVAAPRRDPFGHARGRRTECMVGELGQVLNLWLGHPEHARMVLRAGAVPQRRMVDLEVFDGMFPDAN